MQEIERKFLVINSDYKEQALKKQQIIQGFLSRVPERTVRIRISGEKGFITIKGKSDEKGLSRFEWEKEIPLVEAQELLKLCEDGIIDKTRYYVKVENHTFEIDEFKGSHHGLVIAEVELNHPEEKFPKPEWLGEEVTGDKRYYNSYLSKPN
ncbi:CYTH domain-containing protein [Weeksellaceae bacterium TAE3-ERU29]|nr:CYTH domain-containing protein [Weeksellaceae bacterium TAE3-ERU29]